MGDNSNEVSTPGHRIGLGREAAGAIIEGGAMKGLILRLALASLCLASLSAQDHRSVDKKGQASTIKFESLISGHLAELNGKYKLRVTETTYEPGGYIGDHHNAGPGIRLGTTGQLTYVQPDKTSVYNAGIISLNRVKLAIQPATRLTNVWSF